MSLNFKSGAQLVLRAASRPRERKQRKGAIPVMRCERGALAN